METKKLKKIPEKKEQKESFKDWQERIALKINDILTSELSIDFINTQNENFLSINPPDNNYKVREDVESDILYNITNIAVFLYKNFQDEALELILSILKLYQIQTWLRFLNVNWLGKKVLPKKFVDYASKKDLDEKYILYLLWKNFTTKKYIDKEDEEKKETLEKYNEKIKSLFSESSLFRKKVETKVNDILKINEIEYLRKLINSSFEKISSLETISDRKWVEFLISEWQKELLELQKELKSLKRKLKNTSEDVDKKIIYRDISQVKEEIEATKKDIWLNNVPKEFLSDEVTHIISQEEIERFKNELDKKRLINDNLWIWYLEEEIILKILKEISRFYIEKSWNDKENAIPKNFFENKSLTCFSGTWAIAAMLLKIWFKKEDLFIVNSFKWLNDYNHAFLILRKANWNYLRIDHWFKQVVELSPTKKIDEELIFLLNLWFNNVWYNKEHRKIKFLDEAWRIYKLTDWIMLMYLMNLSHKLIDEWKLDEAMKHLETVKSIDERNGDLNEALWVVYDKIWEKEKSIFHFKRSLSIISHYYMAKHYFETKKYKEAEWWFEYFIDYWRKARWIDKALITSAVQFLNKVKKINEKSNNSEIWMWLEKQRAFLLKMYNHYIYREIEDYEKMKDEYINLSEVDRKRILSILNNYSKWIHQTQPAEIIMDLVKKERFANTELYQKLNIWKFKLII